MGALRCSLCSLDFPTNTGQFKYCPECGEKTNYFSNVTPMEAREAQSILNWKAFAEFYEKWDAERGPLEERECSV